MLQPYNLLALDEPTNHMDIKSKDILKQALKNYDGTLVIVSHDRDFLDGLVDKMYEFRDGRVKEHLGGVEDFLERRKLENLQELERRFQTTETAPVAAPVETESKKDFTARKAVSKEEKKIRNRIAFLEKEIEKTEAQMKKIEAVLASPGPEDDVMELTRDYLNQKRTLDELTDEWAVLLESVE